MIFDGDRGPEPSMHAEVEVVDAAVGGTVTANLPEYVCPNMSFKFTLEGYKGTIVRWQARNTSETDAEWKDIAGTAAENTVTPGEGGVWEYRAEVAMGDCSNAFSKVLKVSVISNATAGIVEPATLYACTGKNFELNAKDFLGKITHWQRSADKGVTWTDIAHTGATYVLTETVTGEVWFRAAVKAGNCAETWSEPSVVTVNDRIGAAGPVSGPVTVCQPDGDLTFSIDAVGGADSYEWTLQNGATFASASNGNTVKVNFDAVNTAATRITVRGISDMCGTGDANTIDIAVYQRPVVSKIAGATIISVGQQETYSVTPVAGAKYEWILPEGWTNLTPGTNSPSITVTSAAFGMGVIKLRVTNEITGCYTEVETDPITVTTGINTGPIYRLPNK